MWKDWRENKSGEKEAYDEAYCPVLPLSWLSLSVCQMYFAFHPSHVNGAENVHTSGAALQLCLVSTVPSCWVLQSHGFVSSSFSVASWSMFSGSSGTYVSHYCMEFSMYLAKLF
jgi:hypothetical protein